MVDSSQGYTSYYSSSTDNGILFNSSYHQEQRAEPPTRNVQDCSNVASLASTSSSGAVNLPQEYGNSHATYPNSDPYGYGNTGYAGYYSGYQQQSNQQYPQPVGAYQNTGAPYQPLSSFQNTGSYAGPPSYSSTYYNPGDYQTSGGYASGGYNNQSHQSNSWNDGNYTSYASHQYPNPNYHTDPNGAYNASAATSTSLQYQQHYNKQWADYYSQTEVSCAPGTENISVTSTSNPVCPVPVTSGYPASVSQPPAPYIPSWRPDSGSSEFPSVQVRGFLLYTDFSLLEFMPSCTCIRGSVYAITYINFTLHSRLTC